MKEHPDGSATAPDLRGKDAASWIAVDGVTARVDESGANDVVGTCAS
jgi:hypothetical protein